MKISQLQLPLRIIRRRRMVSGLREFHRLREILAAQIDRAQQLRRPTPSLRKTKSP